MCPLGPLNEALSFCKETGPEGELTRLGEEQSQNGHLALSIARPTLFPPYATA